SPSAGAVQMRPEYLWLTPDLRVAFMYFGQVNQFPDQNEFSYQPLESVWSGLDRASQNVISHSYDDHALEVLEQPSDIRSDIYSLAATLYHLSTNRKPVDALERSIEILDGKQDPLMPPKMLNSLISEGFEAFLMKALEL